MTNLEDEIMRYLNGGLTVGSVRRYYSDTGTRYSGRRFETIFGGGDREEVANEITAEDLVAVSLLSVNVPGEAAISILETHREELSGYLAKIPASVALWEANDELVDDWNSDAAKAWKVLNGIRDVGWVTASKLLSRKRPHLIPVYDRVVKAALRPKSKDFWIPLRNGLQAHEGRAVSRLLEIRQAANLDESHSLLRILDVAVWMTSQR
jgi:hypothetical protein